MKIEEYLKMIEQDSVIDKNNLTSESLKIPNLIAKYYSHYAAESRILHAAEGQLDQKRLQLFKYYTKDGTDEEYKAKPLLRFPVKSEVEKYYIQADPDYVALDQKVQTQRVKVKILEEQIKALGQRTFHIKNAIENEKFKNGIV